jgi:hypothetical protein
VTGSLESVQVRLERGARLRMGRWAEARAARGGLQVTLSGFSGTVQPMALRSLKFSRARRAGCCA